ncbi:ABC transporter permease [Microvirga sp. W0021]|uniref:ABC transporter permease n=1 Tax=Hohaiivirga grylli TaxID=3133970 RepID=A0ABV0BPB6_9HYPH
MNFRRSRYRNTTTTDEGNPKKDKRPDWEKPIGPALGRGAPLVPVDSAGSRALMAVIAIMTFLAALCAGGAQIVASNSSEWRAAVSREVTIQVRPAPQRDIDADVQIATNLAAQYPGIKKAQAFTKEESERLLEPWLGTGLDFNDLPIPRLIVLELAGGAPPDFTNLRQQLQEQIPGTTLDDHALWMSRLSTMANTVIGVGIMLVVLVLGAVGLAVAFATRGTMAGNREVVEVLHLVGANDDFIAREFQRRFFKMSLKGSAMGAVAAIVMVLCFSLLSSIWRASATGEQLEALFGSFDFGWQGILAIIIVALIVSGITAVVSRATVRHFLTASN